MPTREEKALLTRIQRASKALEEAEEYLQTIMSEEEEAEEEVLHAEYDKSEKGFTCLSGRKKSCKEDIFDAGEIVVHLRDEHGIDPEEQDIDGWSARHEKKAEKYLAEQEAEDEDIDYTRAELKDMTKTELTEILDDWDVEYPSKAKKTALIKLVLGSQQEDEEEDDEEDDEPEEREAGEYTGEELKKMNKKGLHAILDDWEIKYKKKAKNVDLISLILDAQAEESEEEEEEDEEFTPYKLAQKEVKAFIKKHELQKDEAKLIIDYANEEQVSLVAAAEEFELVTEDEESEE